MRYITNRTEIAEAINYRQYPVIKINTHEKDEYGIKGTNILIDNGTFKSGEPYYIQATIRTYDDDPGKLHIKRGGCCIKNSFGYTDVAKMLEYANAPIVKADQDIFVVLDNVAEKTCICMILHTGKRIEPHCSTPLNIENIQ